MSIINLTITNHLVVVTIVTILGLIIGSFLNVVIYRLPIMIKNEYAKSWHEYFNQPSTKYLTLNLAIPRSFCPSCKTALTWWQNIPIISYIFLHGRCGYCKSPIFWRYPIVEILSCITTILVVTCFGINITTMPLLLLTWSLIATIFIDFEQQLLPDQITLPLIWLGLIINTNHTFTSPSAAIIGASSGYLFLWSINKIFKLIRKIDGMGHGDFKLLAVFGAWLGWQALPIIILIASSMGALVGILLVTSKKHQFTQPLPFGPYLALAGWLAFFWGQPIINYLQHYS